MKLLVVLALAAITFCLATVINSLLLEHNRREWTPPGLIGPKGKSASLRH